MKNFLTILLMVFTVVLLTTTLSAQDRFDVSATLSDTLDVGGYDAIVGGVDIDNDGKLEFYVVNTDWFDEPGKDLVPRIYKYEQNASGEWEAVWQTRLAFDYQNTWAPLAMSDLDGDGKMEISWGPPNNLAGGLNPNPERIVVFETVGDGTDNMGVDNGDGTWRPNAQWTIRTAGNQELRPFRWHATDIDNDGTQELVTVLRRDDIDDYSVQIYSVDDVPDAADSTETWTIEFSGLSGSGSFSDITVIDSTAYFIEDGTGDVTPITATGPDTYVVGTAQAGLVPGGSWRSALAVDVDNNGQVEILLQQRTTSNNDVMLLQQSGDTLIATEIGDVPAIGRSYGSGYGDVDGDGNFDWIFGSAFGSTNTVKRLEYQGGAINNPANWTFSVIREGGIGSQIEAFGVFDFDGDGEDEMVYSGVARDASSTPPLKPIEVLERIPVNQPIITDVVDLPNDQGRQVWVVWEGSAEDSSLSPPLANGTIPVAISGPKEAVFPNLEYGGNILDPFRANPSARANTQVVISNYVVWRIDSGLPVQVANVVAIQADMYAAVVPTLGDGSAWTATYVVSAHTADPLTNWKSFPKSGYSIDNLIPTAPTNLAATPVDPDIQLTWDESPDPDFNYFSIRRGDVSGFDPTDPASEIGTTTSIQFIDSNPGGGTWYYRVVAFDFNGNRGEFSPEVSTTLTGIEDEGEALPKEFALYQNYPNPFNPETQIAFDLPTRVDVSITIYNMLGQKVKTLVNESRPAGSHIVLWDGSNNQGIQVASGIYVYSIRAGEFVQSRKMTFMK